MKTVVEKSNATEELNDVRLISGCASCRLKWSRHDEGSYRQRAVNASFSQLSPEVPDIADSSTTTIPILQTLDDGSRAKDHSHRTLKEGIMKCVMPESSCRERVPKLSLICFLYLMMNPQDSPTQLKKTNTERGSK